MGEMNFLTEQLDRFSIFPSFCSRSNSAETLGCRLMRTQRPLWRVAVKFHEILI